MLRLCHGTSSCGIFEMESPAGSFHSERNMTADDARKKHDIPEGLIPSLSTSSPNLLIRLMDPLDPARERVAASGNRAALSSIVLLIGVVGRPDVATRW